MSDITLKLVSFELKRAGGKSHDDQVLPWWASYPAMDLHFTAPDGLKLAIQTQSRYHNEWHYAVDAEIPKQNAKQRVYYDGCTLLVRTTIMYHNWILETKYAAIV